MGASKNSEADLRIKELEKQLQSKGGSSWEITKINKELESVKKVREMEEKISDIEEKWAKSKRINQQRKDKIDKLEQEIESKKTSGNCCKDAANKVKELEKQLENKSNGGSSYEMTKLNRELEALKKQKAEIMTKHEQLEEEYVVLKAKLTMEKDDMSSGYGNMKDDYNTIKGELMALRQTYNSKSDEWIKDKLDLEKQINDLENSIKTSAGNGWDAERNRFK